MTFAMDKKFISLDEKNLRSRFSNFMIDFNKKYQTEAEAGYRYEVFKKNMARINTFIAQSETAMFGVTKFADQTDEEREAVLGFIPPTPQDTIKTPVDPKYKPSNSKMNPKDIPAFNYVKDGLVWPVQDQGSCGSCWSFSTSAAYASSAAHRGYKNPFDVTVQQAVDCVLEASGCGGGRPDMIYDYLADIELKGLQTDTSYPYAMRSGHCQYNETNVKIPFNYGWFSIPPCNDDDMDCSRQDGIAALTKSQQLGHASSVCVYANPAWFDYKGGIFDIFCDNYGPFLNHCVTLYAWDPQNSVLGLQNSWGDQWGAAGNMYIKVDFEDEDFKNPCGVWDYISHIGLPEPKP
jgi:C1A family cysteine protease